MAGVSQEAKNKKASIFDVIPLPTFAVNANGDVTEVNNAALSLGGFKSKAELLQKNFLEVLVSDEDRAEARVRLNEALEGAGAEGKSTKVTIVTRSGRKQVVFRMATSRMEGGKLDGAVVTVQEMGEMRSLVGATEGAGGGGAEHLSGALSASGMALFCIDTEGRILEWTPKIEKITGYSSGQAQGQEVIFCIAENFQRSMRKAIDQALRGLDVARFNVEITAGDKTKEAWLSMAPWRSATGSIVGAVGMFEEAAEVDRRLGEADWVRESTSELLDRANALMFSVDSNMCITEWNHRLADITGKEKEAVLGTKLADLVTAGSQKCAAEAANIALAGDLGKVVQITLKPDLQVIVGMSPQFSFLGKVIGALAIAHVVPAATGAPVSEAAPRSNTNSTFEPGTSRKTKGMVMHELRSPLHGIIGLSNTLSQDKSPMQKPLTMMGRSAERVLDLITNLMDYWNLADDEVRTDSAKDEVTDLAVLAKDVLIRSESIRDKRGKPLKKDKVELKKDLQPATMSGDAQGLTQLLHHLLTNALKFTQEGEVGVIVKQDEATNSAVFSVSDTGIGIMPDNFDRMFEAFQQEDSSESRKYDGIGLGLAIVREVVRIHSGSCDIKSSPKGTTITVSLPCSPPAAGGALSDAGGAAPGGAAVDQQHRSKVPPPGTNPRGPPSSWLGPPAVLGIQIAFKQPGNVNGGSRTATSLPSLKEGLPAFTPKEDDGQKLIMSVDDDFVNQEVMRSILEPCGFKIVACMSGSECLEYLDGDNPRPQLILLDLMMPGLSGFDVLQALQKKHHHGELPIVMVSAKNQASSVAKGYELGCSDWIHKPFCRQELIARVKSHLKTRETLLGFQMMAMHVKSQDQLQEDSIQEKEESHQASPQASQQALPVLDATILKSSADTTVLFASVVSQVEDMALSPIFASFESLSGKHAAFRTEIVGSCYLAVAMSKGDDTHHTDKMLLLAQRMMETTQQASMSLRVGLHTDSSLPAVVIGMDKSQRQYPRSCYFSDTVRKAKSLNDMAADNRIILSRSARCRLSADVEAELQHSGLRLLVSDATSQVGEYYFVAKTTEVDPKPLREQPLSKPLPAQQQVTSEEDKQMLMRSQMALQQLQEELQKSRNGMTMMEQQLSMAKDQMMQAKTESQMLKVQLQQSRQATPVPSYNPIDVQTDGKAHGNSHQSASLLFLQWQNAHLQAEVRHFQQALSNAKADLQMQLMASQLLESKHSLLQARVEHLELDLGFKAACGSASVQPIEDFSHGDLWQPMQSSAANGLGAGAVGMSMMGSVITKDLGGFGGMGDVGYGSSNNLSAMGMAGMGATMPGMASGMAGSMLGMGAGMPGMASGMTGMCPPSMTSVSVTNLPGMGGGMGTPNMASGAATAPTALGGLANGIPATLDSNMPGM